jgi:hypothetical protein
LELGDFAKQVSEFLILADAAAQSDFGITPLAFEEGIKIELESVK